MLTSTTMLNILNQTKTALISLFIFIMGSGLLMSLLPLRLHWQNVSTLLIGGLTTAYYAGLVVGSFRIETIIIRVGHIRVFAAFASLLAVICMLHGFWENPWFWIVLRFLSGICTAALFIVIESWLLAKSSLKTRGQVLSFYMLTFYCAQAFSQFLLNIGGQHSIIPFCIVAMLTSLSVVPLAMTKAVSPEISKPSTLNVSKLYQISPTGVFGCFVAGLMLSAIYGLMPVYLGKMHSSVQEIATMMATIIFGGMVLQYPIGRLSDNFDRRIMIMLVSVLTLIACFGLIFLLNRTEDWLELLFLLILGGATFTMYPLCISHACDQLDSDDIVAGTQGLLLIYSIGATLGPVVAAIFMKPWLGANGLMIYLIILSSILIWILIWRKTAAPQTPEDTQDYITVLQTTPIASELDPRSEDEIPSS